MGLESCVAPGWGEGLLAVRIAAVCGAHVLTRKLGYWSILPLLLGSRAGSFLFAFILREQKRYNLAWGDMGSDGEDPMPSLTSGRGTRRLSSDGVLPPKTCGLRGKNCGRGGKGARIHLRSCPGGILPLLHPDRGWDLPAG